MSEIVIFPLRLPKDLHVILTKASFVVGKSKSRYVKDLLIKEATVDAQKIQIIK
jgi:hypothetical protein